MQDNVVIDRAVDNVSRNQLVLPGQQNIADCKDEDNIPQPYLPSKTVSKTDSIFDIVNKVVYVYLIGSKAVLYLCFSSSFLFNIVMIHHFYGQYLGYGRVRVFADLTRVHNIVESGHYLYRLFDWSLFPGGVKTGECPMLAKASLVLRPLSIACSTEKQGEPGIFFHVSDVTTNEKLMNVGGLNDNGVIAHTLIVPAKIVREFVCCMPSKRVLQLPCKVYVFADSEDGEA